MQMLGDVFCRAISVSTTMALGSDNIRDVNKRRALHTDIDKGRLHTGQNTYHLARIDIANDAFAGRTFNMDILDSSVIHQCHPGFHRCEIDQDLFTHVDIRCADSVVAIPHLDSSCQVSHSGRPTTLL